jgi:hypothetical protein
LACDLTYQASEEHGRKLMFSTWMFKLGFMCGIIEEPNPEYNAMLLLTSAWATPVRDVEKIESTWYVENSCAHNDLYVSLNIKQFSMQYYDG